jgi:hypothetical protein
MRAAAYATLFLAVPWEMAGGQTVQLPQDGGKFHVSVCLNDARSPAEAKYVEWFDQEPTLRQIKAQTFFHVYLASDPVFRSNLAPALPCGCPAVIVQRNREYSGPLYAAGLFSRAAPLPQSAAALADKLVAAFRAEMERSPGQYAWFGPEGEALPGGPYYCDECRRRHAPPKPLPSPSPSPLPAPIHDLVPNIETDVGPALALSELSPMHPLVTALCCTLVVLLVLGLGLAALVAVIWLCGVHRERVFRRRMLQAGAILAAGGLAYQADQHKKRHQEIFHKVLEAGAAVLGFTWFDSLRHAKTGKPMLIQDLASYAGDAHAQAAAGQAANNLSAAAPDPTPLLSSLISQIGSLSARIDGVVAAKAAAPAAVPANPTAAAKAA